MTIEQRIADLIKESEKLGEVLSEDEAKEAAEAQLVEEEAEATAEAERLAEEERIAEETRLAEEEALKIDVADDVAALVNGEELSEEFKTKAATIFEAAVVARVKAEKLKLEEEFASKLEEAIDVEVEGLIEKVDGYLGYMAEQWMSDNEVALERALKTDILESFVSDLKVVFEGHNINVPTDKVDFAEELEAKLEETNSKLDDTIKQNISLTETLSNKERAELVTEAVSGLTDTEVEKFKTLAEELIFEGTESFTAKLKVIRENYFTKTTTPTSDNLIEETNILNEEEISPRMQGYVDVMARS